MSEKGFKKLTMVFMLSMMLITMGTISFAVSQWEEAEPLGTRNVSSIDDYVGANNDALDRLLVNYKEGCSLTYTDASTITIEIGELALSNSAKTDTEFRRITSSIAVTTSNLDTGSSFTASTTYYIYGNADADATTFTATVSLSSSAPTGVTQYRKIGKFTTDADGDIDQTTVYDLPELDGTALGSSASIPSGVILMWSGSEASIPSGWVLCDGDNSTPDLRNKFVIGAGDTYTEKDEGGASTHTHTAGSFAGSSHTHSFSDSFTTSSYTPSVGWGTGNDGTSNHPLREAHSHTGTASGTTGGTAVTITGTSASGSTLPPYYALCYIMKS